MSAGLNGLKVSAQWQLMHWYSMALLFMSVSPVVFKTGFSLAFCNKLAYMQSRFLFGSAHLEVETID